MSEFVREETTQEPIDDSYKFDESEYEYNIGTVQAVNELIQKSKGEVSKDQIGFDGNFIRTTGETTEYFQLKGLENGFNYSPGDGWYKFNIR